MAEGSERDDYREMIMSSLRRLIRVHTPGGVRGVIYEAKGIGNGAYKDTRGWHSRSGLMAYELLKAALIGEGNGFLTLKVITPGQQGVNLGADPMDLDKAKGIRTQVKSINEDEVQNISEAHNVGEVPF